MRMRRSKDGNLRKLAHDSKVVVFSLMDPTQCCLSVESLSSHISASKTDPVMTDKSQSKPSAGLCKRDLADLEDQRADLRVSHISRAKRSFVRTPNTEQLGAVHGSFADALQNIANCMTAGPRCQSHAGSRLSNK